MVDCWNSERYPLFTNQDNCAFSIVIFSPESRNGCVCLLQIKANIYGNRNLMSISFNKTGRCIFEAAKVPMQTTQGLPLKQYLRARTACIM